MYFKYIIMPQEARPCTNFQENILKVLSLPWKKHFLFGFTMKILWRLRKENLSKWTDISLRKSIQIGISLAKWDYSGTTKNCNSGCRV